MSAFAMRWDTRCLRLWVRNDLATVGSRCIMMGFETAARPRTGPQNASCAGGLPLSCAAGKMCVFVFVFDIGDKRWDGKLKDGIDSCFEEDGQLIKHSDRQELRCAAWKNPNLLPEHCLTF